MNYYIYISVPSFHALSFLSRLDGHNQMLRASSTRQLKSQVMQRWWDSKKGNPNCKWSGCNQCGAAAVQERVARGRAKILHHQSVMIWGCISVPSFHALSFLSRLDGHNQMLRASSTRQLKSQVMQRWWDSKKGNPNCKWSGCNQCGAAAVHS